jgi:serine/threonine protein kinase/predicted Zn-dependent protease
MAEPSLPEESLFAQALELDAPAERAAFLDRACGHDPALRAAVEALLRAHERSGDLLDLPDTGPATANQPISEGPGTRLGRYKLLEQIGEGGMGTVWMADQAEPVRRRVALKVIKAGMNSAQVLARFEAERQALALMEHPNIARVLDGGQTPSGRPYFVMELVKGQPITQYCDDKRLAVRERLSLFADVCRAVQHAHQKGVIHRDLKPSNVLVAPYDGRPVVKVIDFGVAKATGQRLTDQTLFTGFGALVGTPEYMSPEQAEVNNQDIDTRSDIYSLGVLLFELLTGSTPLTHKRAREAALLEVLRVIREEEPPRPSTRLSTTAELPAIAARRGLEPKKLSGLLRGELDWIVMKALDKDRGRRYETANGLARDLERYLHDQPVEACPPSPWYALRKLARRYRAALAAGVLVCAALLLALAVLAVSNVRINREKDARDEALQQARANEEKATRAASRAETVTRFLTILLSEAAPDRNDVGMTAPELFRRASQKILNQPRLTEQPEVEASLRLVIGNTYFKLGELGEAGPQLRRAVELRRAALGPEHADTLAAQEGLAWFLCGGLGKPAEAEALSRQTWEARRRVLGPDDRDTLDSMDTYVSTLIGQEKWAAAEPLARECWHACQRALGFNDRDTLIRQNNLGHLLSGEGKYAAAESVLRDCLERVRRHVGVGRASACLNNLAYALMQLGKLEEAEKLLREGLAASLTSHGAEHFETLHLQHLLSRVLLEQGRRDEAEKLCRATLELRRKVLPGHENVGRSLLVLGRVLAEGGRFAEGERRLLEAADIFRKACPNKRDLTAEADGWLAACLAGQKRYAEAEPLALGSYEVLRDLPAVPARDRDRARGRLAKLYTDWGRHDSAARWREQRSAQGQ